MLKKLGRPWIRPHSLFSQVFHGLCLLRETARRVQRRLIGLTREHCGSPSRNITTQKTPTTAIFRRPLLSTGNSSTSAVTTVSSIANWLSTPNVNSMMKNSTDQNGAMGIIAIPSGYATNARPGPVATQRYFQILKKVKTVSVLNRL